MTEATRPGKPNRIQDPGTLDPTDNGIPDDRPPFDFNIPAAPFAALDSTVPLLLLPVRVETRYRLDHDPPQLWVRIYPDQIHIERDVIPVSDVERTRAEAFWQDWHAAPDERRRVAAWSGLVADSGRRRARQIADLTLPTKGDDGRLDFPTPPKPPGPPTPQAEPSPARAALLPGQFVVTGYDVFGRQLFRKGGASITDDLRTGATAAEPTWDINSSGVVIDDDLAWMVDYARAVEAGMAITIDLVGDAEPAQNGIATLTVTGVDASLDADAAADALTSLLESHRATDGLAFLPQGTPTNNTDDVTSGWTSADRAPTTAVTKPASGITSEITSTDGPPTGGTPTKPTTPGQTTDQFFQPDNATRFARLLGLGDSGRWRTLESGTDTEFADSQAMRVATFEVAFGTLLRELLMYGDEPGLEPPAVNEMREWFVDQVTGGAPVPTIRVGRQPYGILPVRTALSEPDLATTVGRVEHVTNLLAPNWRIATRDVPTIDHGATDSSTDISVESAIATILATQPHPARILWRQLDGYDSLSGLERMFTPQFYYELALLALSETTNPALAAPYTHAASLYVALGGDSFNNEIEDQVELWQEMDDTFPDWLASESGHDPQGKAQGFIASVRSIVESYEHRQYPLQLLDLDRRAVALGIRVIGTDGQPTAASPVNTTLVSALLYDSTDEWGEFGLVQADDAPDGQTAADYLANLRARFDQRNDDHILVQTLHPDFIAHPPLLYQLIDATARLVPHQAPIEDAFADALDRLAELDVAQLEWLLRESLGLGTHRLDAWHTSIASAQLDTVRGQQPAGLQIGAYGVVTDLVPSDAGSPSQGFIHAPSLSQAATAAMLRSGWQAHGDTDPSSSFAVDLSSRRVRDARWLLDGISGGQPLGELLGCRFERALHDSGHDSLIRLTRQAVLTAQGRPNASLDQPVDGIDLLDLVRSTEVDLVGGALDAFELVEATFDAANDLAIAEGVHQLAAGNYGRASAMLDAVATGTSRPPDAEIVRTHRAGTAIEHRLLLVLPAVAPASPSDWSAGLRDQVAPQVEWWLGTLLPPPAEVGFTVVDDDGATTITLAELGTSVLDAIHLVSDDPGEASPALTTLVACVTGATSAITIDAHARGSIRYSLAEFGVLADELRRVLDRAHVGDARDARPASDAGTADSDTTAALAAIDTLTADFAGSIEALETAITSGKIAELALPIEQLARFGLACPGPVSDVSAAGALLATAQSRQQQLLGTPSAPPSGPGKPGPVGTGRPPFGQLLPGQLPGPSRPPVDDPAVVPPTPEQQLALLFSRKLPILGMFQLTGVSTPDALAAPDPDLATVDDIDEWLDAIGRVRPDVGRLTHVGLLADALGGATFGLVAGQHPRSTGEAWAATSLPTGPGSRLCITYVTGDPSTTVVDDAGSVCALVIDRWVEQIPNTDQVTGVAFHFDAPTNQAPQSALLAVLADGQEWSIDVVHDTLLETLDWMRIRAVAPEDLDILGRSVPSTFVPGAIKPWPAGTEALAGVAQ